MKVVQVLPALESGGVEKGTLEIAKGLVEAGHESIVISAGGQMVSLLEAEGSRHVYWDLGRKTPWTFRHVFAIRRWLQREKPDILHLRSRMPAWVCWLAWRGLPEKDRPRLVTTVHGLYSVSKYSAVMCKGERVIAVSETVRKYIEDNYPESDLEKIRVIYRGIDPVEFPYGYRPSEQWLSDWYQQYPQLKGVRVLTLPGRLTRLKGHHDFIDLLKEAKQAGYSFHGLIVGGVDPKRQAYAHEIKKRVEDEGLSDTVTFTGARSDIGQVFAVSDVVLSLSNKPESFGRTVLEALSIGVPVIGYDHGGVGEILGRLYPEGLVKKRVGLQDLERVIHCTPACRSHDMTKDRMVDSTIDLYRELLSE